MKKLTIYGTASEAGFSLHMMSGDPASTDAFNTLMQVLRHCEFEYVGNTFDYTFPITL